MPDRRRGAASVRHGALGFVEGRQHALSFFQYSGHDAGRHAGVTFHAIWLSFSHFIWRGHILCLRLGQEFPS